MAAPPTVSTLGLRGLTGSGDVATADIADSAVTNAKLATDAVSGDKIAAFGVTAGKLGLGAVSNYLAMAAGVVRPYHLNGSAITASSSRNIAASDLQARMVSCTGPITLTIPDGITTSSDGSWPLGHSTLIGCANASTVTIAVSGSQAITAANGLVLTGAGAIGLLTRVATSSWRFVILSGSSRVPMAALSTTSGTPSSSTFLRGDGAWAAASPVSIAAKTADETITNNAVLADDSDLVLAVAANTIYAVEALILCSSAATPDFSVGWSGPTGAQLYWSEDQGVAANNASFITNTLTIAGNAGENIRHTFLVGSLVVAGTAGSLAVRWAQNTSDPGNATLRAGSWLKLTKVP